MYSNSAARIRRTTTYGCYDATSAASAAISCNPAGRMLPGACCRSRQRAVVLLREEFAQLRHVGQQLATPLPALGRRQDGGRHVAAPAGRSGAGGRGWHASAHAEPLQSGQHPDQGARRLAEEAVHACRVVTPPHPGTQQDRSTHASATAASNAAMFSSAGGLPFLRLSSLVNTTVKGTCRAEGRGTGERVEGEGGRTAGGQC